MKNFVLIDTEQPDAEADGLLFFLTQIGECHECLWSRELGDGNWVTEGQIDHKVIWCKENEK